MKSENKLKIIEKLKDQNLIDPADFEREKEDILQRQKLEISNYKKEAANNAAKYSINEGLLVSLLNIPVRIH